MANYTVPQLISLWIQAGGSALYAPVAAAIAMAESGGNPNAVNSSNSNGSTDRGLWQINSIHGSQSTLDPVANARAAVAISKGGTDWRPWCVAWSNGKCGGTFLGAGSPVLKYMPQDQASLTGTVPTGGTGNATYSPIATDSPASVVAGVLGKLFGAGGNILDPANLGGSIRKWLQYVLYIGAGFIMMLIGAVLLVLSTRTVKGAVRHAIFGGDGPDVVVVAERGEKGEPGLPGAAGTSAVESIEPITSIPAPVPPAIGTAAIPAKPPYKPRHEAKVKRAGTRKVLAVRGKDEGPGELGPTPGYKGRRQKRE